jgi:uncharacterized membrane protein YsdA (DUF1294 family)
MLRHLCTLRLVFAEVSLLMVALSLATLFLLLLTGSAFLGKLPLAVLALYLGASAITFLAYWFDKTAARNAQRRTPENSLQLLGLVGGWPGALIAQRVLHHKTRKISFQIVCWSTVAVNCSFLVWLSSRFGWFTLHLH